MCAVPREDRRGHPLAPLFFFLGVSLQHWLARNLLWRQGWPLSPTYHVSSQPRLHSEILSQEQEEEEEGKSRRYTYLPVNLGK